MNHRGRRRHHQLTRPTTPVDNFVVPVADGAADPETMGPRAEVAPVAQRCFGDADQGGDFLQRHQLVVGVGEFAVQGMWCGAHDGSPQSGSVGYDRC